MQALRKWNGTKASTGQLSTIAAASVLFCLFLSSFATAPVLASYTRVKLQLTPEWVFYDARALSEDGRAGGYIRVSNSNLPFDVPVVWNQKGVPTVLRVADSYTQAYVHNFASNGDPLGNYGLTFTSPIEPARWIGGNFRSLTHFGPGGTALAANDSLIVGQAGDPKSASGSFYPRPTIWDADGRNPRFVSGLSDHSGRCTDINNTGIYVGNLRTSATPQVFGAFVGRDGSAEQMQYEGFGIRTALDVNESGSVVGTWTEDGLMNRAYVARAFTDEIRDLGLLPGFSESLPRAINDHGVIVGVAGLGTVGDHAVIWPAGATQPVDLNSVLPLLPGEVLREAIDINNAGQILARGTHGYHIFTPVPEPAAAAGAVGVGAAAILSRRRRR